MGSELWESLLIGRLLPSVTSTLTGLVVVWLVIQLFRLRNPQTRYILLHLPLIKGLLVLIRGVPAPLPGREGRLGLGLQILDPFSLIRLPSFSARGMDVRQVNSQPQWDHSLLVAAFLAAVILALGLLLYRWAGLILFYRRLLSLPAATREDEPDLFDTLDRLVATFKVDYPRLILVEDPPIGPCTVGVRPATVILPCSLVADLGREEMEAVLAHELAHVSRRDGLKHWPSLLLRDLQAFNPVVHKLFDRLLVEREKDSDQRAAQATGRPNALAKALVDVALLARGAELRPAPGSMSLRHNLMGRTPVVEERVSALLNGPIPASSLRPLGLLVLGFLMLLVRLWVQFPIAGHVIMLE